MTVWGPAPADGPCHECGAPADEACERCARPTCAQSYAERAHLGLCLCCAEELDASPHPVQSWPYRLRAPLPPSQTPPPASPLASEFTIGEGIVVKATSGEAVPEAPSSPSATTG